MGTRRARAFAAAAVLAGAIAALAGIAYSAIPAGDGAIHACMVSATGTIRLIDPSLGAQSARSHCTSLESDVTWSQRGPAGVPGPPGPPGPPGNSDSTVRHISNFMFDGTTATTPIVSAKGEIGKLSLFCGSATDGSTKGVGHVTYTTDNPSASVRDAITFYSPSVPVPATWQQVNGQATFSWNEPPGDNVVFETM